MNAREHNPQEFPPAVRLNQLATGLWIFEALYVAAKLSVADHLKEGPVRVDQLATAVGAHAGALYRLMRALASVGVFREVEPRRFGLTPMGACLQTDVPDSVRALILTGDFQRE